MLVLELKYLRQERLFALLDAAVGDEAVLAERHAFGQVLLEVTEDVSLKELDNEATNNDGPVLLGPWRFWVGFVEGYEAGAEVAVNVLIRPVFRVKHEGEAPE